MGVLYDDGTEGQITLDSGAGVSVWPKSLHNCAPTGPPTAGLKMIAANGSEIENYGTKLVAFRGADARQEGTSGFRGQVQ